MTTNTIPLCVDLDGTLIRNDTLQLAIRKLLRRNPCYALALLWWLLHGRAYLKQQVAQRVSLDPVQLPYNETFLAWVKQQKQQGRLLVLVTATDQRFAKAVADHLGIFDVVIASDGRTNVRSKNKRDALNQRFGQGQYDYAGNDYPDIAVWKATHRAIVVNAPPKLVAYCRQLPNLGEVFD